MTRRIVRTIIQVASAAVFTFLVVFFLDRNFRVLPTSIHEYMPQHHAGLIITDITVTQCSSLNLFSSCALDPEVWHRIDKDLFLGLSRFSSGYIYLRRKKEEDLTAEDRVVMDVYAGRLDPSTTEKGSSGEKWESRPAGLWVKRSSKRHASDSKKAVTGVDVLFGEDAVEVREGWEMLASPLLLDTGSAIPQLTIRRGSPHEHAKPKLMVNEHGRFKIMQLADLHLSTGVGRCRDAVPGGYHGGKCEADPRTLDFVTKILEEEKPDFVVLSGDQVNGDTAPDAQTAIFKYAHLLIKHKIPYVSIFGNHDDEGSMSRSAQMSLIETLPYSLSKAGPEDIDGVGNYYVEVYARGSSGHSAITVYLLDTHSYSPNERKYKGYDWVKKNQIEWFTKTAQSLKKQHQEYTHHHMDVSFIHIPLPEYRDPEIYFYGPWKEPPTAPLFNSGFRDALVEQGVVMVSCGHDHVNEFCAISMSDEEEVETRRPELWMCYAGATGFGGYAGYGGFYRKIRMFEFDMNDARITTWKRVEWGENDETSQRIDEQIIVDAGKPVPPPPPPPPEEEGA
ncbi:calcineurin-like phosphoesterase [Thozetella sp. PMI_491]|nr:calcineurin-like phosphoesterase [Thozetella sp. PMI_491]